MERDNLYPAVTDLNRNPHFVSFVESYEILCVRVHGVVLSNLYCLHKRLHIYVRNICKLTKMSHSTGVHVNIGDMRKKYCNKSETFLESNLQCKEPVSQFKEWFDDACKCPEIHEANAMILSTASRDSIPSGRPLLMKSFGSEGFTFFTNYESRKARDLNENPKAALTFYWGPLKRVVRIEGIVQKVHECESDEYFHSRPRDSQIGACASKQSQVIAGRNTLNEKVQELAALYEGHEIPRPSYWGGYRVVPKMVEFWQGQSDRLHDRIRFRKPDNDELPDGHLLHKGDNGWVYERLSP